MVKFREIIRLHELGYNQSEIAQSCAVARSTVQGLYPASEGQRSELRRVVSAQ